MAENNTPINRSVFENLVEEIGTLNKRLGELSSYFTNGKGPTVINNINNNNNNNNGAGGNGGAATSTDIDVHISDIYNRASEISSRITHIETTISDLSDSTKAALKNLQTEITNIITNIDTKIGKIDNNVENLLKILKQVDIKKIQESIKETETKLTEIQDTLANVDDKIDDIQEAIKGLVTKEDLEKALKEKGLTLKQLSAALSARGVTKKNIDYLLKRVEGIDQLIDIATASQEDAKKLLERLDIAISLIGTPEKEGDNLFSLVQKILDLVGGGRGGNDGTDPGPENKGKYLKGKFLTKGLEQTNILSEPKRPWYKKLAGFAVNHPILTTLIGGAIGLGVTAAAVGVFAAAGISGMLATANFFVPSLAIGTGIGAVAGGVTSGVSNIIPAGRLERLCRKFDKQYKKCQKIDKKKDWYAAQEQVHEAKKLELEDLHKNKKGILKSRRIYKLARNFHKRAQRLDRKKKRYYTRRLVKQGEKALTTKAKVNTKESKRGKTKALAGYVEKKKKLEEKLISGKISQEEFNEDMADLAEDFADLDGGSAGLEGVGNQLYGDQEAINIVDMIAEDTDVTKNGMSDIVESIRKRNSREVIKVEERVVKDFDEQEQEAAELEAKGDEASKSKAKKIREEIARMKEERQAYVDIITRSGGEPEPFIVVDENGNEIKNKKQVVTPMQTGAGPSKKQGTSVNPVPPVQSATPQGQNGRDYP